MPTVRELITTWGFDVDFTSLNKMDAKVGELTRDVRTVGQNIDAIGKSMIGFGTRLTAFVTLPVLGLGASFVKAAADAEEIESKFNTVFESISGQAANTAKSIAKNYGLSRVETKELLAGTGDLLVGFKFTEQSSLDLSSRVLKLAADLESFQNLQGGVVQATNALTKGLLGEREMLKSLGIVVNEKNVNAQIAINTAKGLTFESEQQAKAVATLQLAEDQSSKALGDKARTMQSVTNQYRLMISDVKDLSVEFGKILIPMVKDLISELRSMVFWFSELDVGTKENILTFLGIIAVIGPAILIMGLLLVSVVKIIRVLRFLRLVLFTLNASFLVIPIIIGLVIVALLLFAEDMQKWVTGQKSLLGEWLGSWTNAKDQLLLLWDSLSNRMDELRLQFTDFLEFINANLIVDIAKQVFTSPGETAILPGSPRERRAVASGTINRNVNVDASVTIQVPEGTSQSQADFLKDQGREAVKEEIEMILRIANNEFPEIE